MDYPEGQTVAVLFSHFSFSSLNAHRDQMGFGVFLKSREVLCNFLLYEHLATQIMLELFIFPHNITHLHVCTFICTEAQQNKPLMQMFPRCT